MHVGAPSNDKHYKIQLHVFFLRGDLRWAEGTTAEAICVYQKSTFFSHAILFFFFLTTTYWPVPRSPTRGMTMPPMLPVTGVHSLHSGDELLQSWPASGLRPGGPGSHQHSRVQFNQSEHGWCEHDLSLWNLCTQWGVVFLRGGRVQPLTLQVPCPPPAGPAHMWLSVIRLP